jgi:glycosyltransferase involved in cell wall biosynthesis
MEDKPLVSVIIPTMNSEKHIKSCLEGLMSQTYGRIEIIVVDNYSQDRTVEIVSGFPAKVIFCDGIRSKARNFGACSSNGALLLSVDSDMRLAPRVIGECVDAIGDGFDAIVVPELSIGEGFWASCKALEKRCYLGDDLIEASRFFRKTTFEKVGGYDPELEAGEDWDIHERIRALGGKIHRVESIIEHDEGNLSLRTAVSKKYGYGKTMKRYVSKHPERAKKQLSIVRLAFFRSWRKLANDPIHGFGLFVVKACEFIATNLGNISQNT